MNFKEWLQETLGDPTFPNPLDMVKRSAGKVWPPIHTWQVYFRANPDEIPIAKAVIKRKLTPDVPLKLKSRMQEIDKALRDIALAQDEPS
jgi:hypothetical protein